MKHIIKGVMMGLAVICAIALGTVPLSALATSPVVGSDAYVQSGLIAQWDGIENVEAGQPHDPAATYPKEIKSGIATTLTGTMSAGDNYFALGSGALKFTCSEMITAVNAGDATVEICLEKNGSYVNNGGLVSLGDTQRAFWLWQASAYFVDGCSYEIQHGGSNSDVKFTGDNKNTLSFQLGANTENSSYLLNGAKQNTITRGTVQPSTSENCHIGQLNSSFDYKANAKVYSIRLYSRKLTDVEVALNVAVDKIRFDGANPEEVLPEGYRWNPQTGKIEKPIAAEVTGATGPAYGTAYSCTLTVTDPADGYTALWYDGSDYTLSAAPTHTEEGVYEDSVKVTKAGYYDFYGTGVVTIASLREVSARRASNDAIVIAWGAHSERTDIYIVWDEEDHPDATNLCDWPNSQLALSLTDASEPGEAEFARPDGARYVRVVTLKSHTGVGIEYLESLTSTGTQILDLGYQMTATTGVEIDISMSNGSGSNSSVPFFGAYDGASPGSAIGTQCMIWYYGSGTYRLYLTANTVDTSRQVKTSTPGERETLKIDPGKTFSIGSVSKAIGANSQIPQNNLAVFGVSKTGGFNAAATQMYNPTVYEVRLYEGETLVRQFRPASVDGTATMVDILDESRQASNVGTTTDFIRGAEIPLIGQTVERFDFGPAFSQVMATVENYAGIADGQAHAATVTVAYPSKGYTIRWAEASDDPDYSITEPPAYSEAGSYTNLVKITAPEIDPFYGECVVTIAEVDPVLASPKGLKISVLGDSWSTLSGVTKNQVIGGEGTSYYYPKSGNDVDTTAEMWWKITADALGMTVDTVDAWGGSGVSMVSSASTTKFGSSMQNRVEGLGDPDVIVIMPVGNDNWIHISLRGETTAQMVGDYCYDPKGWTFDSTSAATQKASSLYGYRAALACLLTRVHNRYPRARIYYAVSWSANSVNSDALKESAEEVCAHYGVPFCPMVSTAVEIDSGSHPTVAGQLKVAEYMTNLISNDFIRAAALVYEDENVKSNDAGLQRKVVNGDTVYVSTNSSKRVGIVTKRPMILNRTLLVGGGGAGGQTAGGGGAGGAVAAGAPATMLQAGTRLTLRVGAGGDFIAAAGRETNEAKKKILQYCRGGSAADIWFNGLNGQPTTLNYGKVTLSAAGGGGGGGWGDNESYLSTVTVGQNGASGGGGTRDAAGGAATAGFGGGAGASATLSTGGAGGGGGAGSAGANAAAGASGIGGAGVTDDITGESLDYGAGGGGGGYTMQNAEVPTVSAGAAGGTSAGAGSAGATCGFAGKDGFGGGGGGGGYGFEAGDEAAFGYVGGKGGDGSVALRFATDLDQVVATIENYSGFADGQAHAATVTVAYPDVDVGYTIRWAEVSDNPDYSITKPPAYSEVGVHRNLVKVTAPNLESFYGECIVEIREEPPVDVTGADDTYVVGNDVVYVFSTVGTEGKSITFSSAATADILVVGGGGGGGSVNGGGGGGGGVVYLKDRVLSAGTYEIAVGAAGAAPTGNGGNNANCRGGNGGDSSLGDWTAKGGGGGGYYQNGAGNAGGCGGGSNGPSGVAGASTQELYNGAGHGTAGVSSGSIDYGGGGGGAGTAASGMTGGDGYPCSITGEELYYGAGGGAGQGAQGDSITYPGGRGGGGTGGKTNGNKVNGDKVSATAGTFYGAGGGGGRGSLEVGSRGAAGYQGVVIVRVKGGDTPEPPTPVEPTVVTVTPTANQSKTVGAADPVLTYTLSQNIAVTGALARATGETVGTYAINLGTLGAADPTAYTLQLAATPVYFSITAAPEPGPGVTVGADAYVQRGLIAQWDGIENVGAGQPHDPAATYPKEIKSGIDATLTGTMSAGDNYFALGSGALQFSSPEMITAVNAGDATVEICLEKNGSYVSNGGLVTLGNSQRAFWLWQSSSYFVDACSYENAGGNSANIRFTGDNKNTLSFQLGADTENSSYLLNGTKQSTIARGTVQPSTTEACRIGQLNSSFTAKSRAKVYSIRLYSRKLTDVEVALNVAVDKIRFDGANPEDVLPEGYRWNPQTGKIEGPIAAEVTGARGPVDGTAYSCTLTVTDPADGCYTAKWAWSDAEDFTHDAPNAYDAEGVYTNLVKVTAEGYVDFYGTGVVMVANAADIYVAPAPAGNDDTGDGSQGAPYATITKGVTAAKAAGARGAPSATVHVGAGTYEECGFDLDAVIKIVGTGATSDDVIIDAKSAGRAFTLSADGAMLANLTVQNGQTSVGMGANVYMTADGVVSNCVIKDATLNVWDGKGGNVSMTQGTLTDCKLIGGVGDGSHSALGSAIYATGGRICRCEIRDAVYQGAGTIVVNLDGAVVFENSLVCNCKAGKGASYSPCVLKVNNANARVVNCTVVGNASAKYGVRVENGMVVNTVIFDNGGTAEMEWGGANAAKFVNCAFAKDLAPATGTACIDTVTDAAFKDYANGDYRLVSDSVLKGAGVTKSKYNTYGATSETDLIGTLWGKTLDIGCYAAKAAGLMLILR